MVATHLSDYGITAQAPSIDRLVRVFEQVCPGEAEMFRACVAISRGDLSAVEPYDDAGRATRARFVRVLHAFTAELDDDAEGPDSAGRGARAARVG